MESILSVPSSNSLLSALENLESVPPARPSLFYRAGLLLVGIAVLLLPLVYLAAVLGLCYGVYSYGASLYQPIMKLGSTPVHMSLWKATLYFGPMLLGLVAVLFMIKPLVAGRPKRSQPYVLNPEDEPILHEFICRISQAVGAPLPARIDLTCDFKAGATYGQGAMSVLNDELILTIGMPLVANLTVQEFAGILAREFGYYTPGMGGRLSFLIRKVNEWFAHSAFEKDAWDKKMDDLSAAGVPMVGAFVQIARLGGWLPRLLLHGLLKAANGISCLMLRQMESKADHFEVTVSGSAAFERLVARFAVAQAGVKLSLQELKKIWERSGRLPDNFSLFLMRRIQAIPKDLQTQITTKAALRQTQALDLRFSDGDRIRAARKAAEPGRIQSHHPARHLFHRFDVPARYVTLMLYKEDLGLPVNMDKITGVDSGSGRSTSLSHPDVRRFFYGVEEVFRPLRFELKQWQTPASPEEAAEFLRCFKQRMEAAQPQIQAVLQDYASWMERLPKLRLAMPVVASGHAVDTAVFGLRETGAEGAWRAVEEAEKAVESCQRQLGAVAQEVKQRLCLAIGLIGHPLVGGSGTEAFVERKQALSMALAEHAQRLAQLAPMRRELTILADWVEMAQAGHAPNPWQQTAFHEKYNRLKSMLPARAAAKNPSSLSKARPFIPPDPQIELSRMLQEGEQIWLQAQEHYLQVLADLVQLAESVEAGLLSIELTE